MKWSVAVLVTLGLLASLSAAILVKFLRARESGISDLSAETEVVLVSKDAPAMSVLKSSDIIVKKVPKNKLSPGYLSDAVLAVGRILAVPVVKDQMLTESCFVKEGSSAQVAALLPPGKRAVAITLTSTSISGGLLYPGCVVDVLASFRMPHSERGEALSTTLLPGISVLAVEGTSVVTSKEDEDEAKNSSRQNQNRLTVTLMVDPRQAEALQLATDHGKVSLALRNPLDKTPVDQDVTVLSQMWLAQGGSAMTSAVIDEEGEAGEVQQLTDQIFASATSATKDDTNGGNGGSSKQSAPKKQKAGGNNGKLSWPVTVIRGAQIDQIDLDLPELKITANIGAK